MARARWRSSRRIRSCAACWSTAKTHLWCLIRITPIANTPTTSKSPAASAQDATPVHWPGGEHIAPGGPARVVFLECAVFGSGRSECARMAVWVYSKSLPRERNFA